jgi:tRNA pseudouridine55 synthase
VSAAGLLVIDKCAGVTSFDAVAEVRRRLRVRRVGHAGTLDPGATGVLPILIGDATKLMPYLVDQDKEYRAVLRLGLSTDTLDASGRIVATAPVPPLTRAEVQVACRPFVGRIRQVPPMYSAVHHEGHRLYELARQGIEVDRRPRDVVVHALEVEEVAGGRLVLRVVCGKGTYVRVLAADLGTVLGCGAVVERLVRTRVGPFDLTHAVPWGDLAALAPDALSARVLPPETALAGWPTVRLDVVAARRFAHGQAVEPPAPTRAGLVRVHAPDGTFLGVGEGIAGGTRVKPVRILNVDRPGTRVLPV